MGKISGGHVFADPAGRRWRTVRLVLVVLLLLGLGVVSWHLPSVLTSPHATAERGPSLTAEQVGLDVPYIGRGPLERVVKVDHGSATAVDPFTGDALGPLDEQAMVKIGSSRYAVQQYGYSDGLSKALALTFDDGPDPKNTPALLDLLSREGAHATFFVLGKQAAKYPDIVERMAREGHTVAIHSVTHPRFTEQPRWRNNVEIIGVDRQIRGITGHQSQLWRMPYAASAAKEGRKNLPTLLASQQLGYVHATYDMDSRDWDYNDNPAGSHLDIPLPDMSRGDNVTILMHDAGGPNRDRTVAYVERLIREAKANGYTFRTIPGLAASVATADAQVNVTGQDRLTQALLAVWFDWPGLLMRALFFVAIAMVLGLGLTNALLAAWRVHRRRRQTWPPVSEHDFKVSVVIAAFNEQEVIARTIHTILQSDYPIVEVLVIDDGSTDATADRVREVAALDERVQVITKANGGKSAALNLAFGITDSEVVVTLDADTIIDANTVGNLVRHFVGNPRLAGVAGVVRVGNRTKNAHTRWQALEYVTQIGLDRSAQDALGAISIVPGACAAWRTDAVAEAGGFSHSTLAEDCDLALTLQENDWRVTQDDEAYAYTEAPETLDALLKQRERWTYGTLQAVWKHRGMMFRRRHGFLGMFILPNFLFQVAFPILFLPFVAVFTVLLVISDGIAAPLMFYLGFMAMQMLISAAAVVLMREDPRHLLVVPLYRVVNDPLRAYLLYTALLQAVKGARVGWNKLKRTGSMDAALTTPTHPVPAHLTPMSAASAIVASASAAPATEASRPLELSR